MKKNAKMLYENQKSFLPWIMWGIAVSFYFFQFVLRVSPGAMADDIMRDLLLDAGFLGTLTSFYYYGYASAQIPIGLIIDKLGPRRPLFFSCLFCAVGCLTFALGDSVFIMALGRLLIGIASAMGLITCLKTASQWFPANRLPMLISLTMFFGTIGGAGAGTPLSEVVSIFGWRLTIIYLSVASLGLAGFVWFFKKDCPPATEEEVKKMKIFDALKLIIVRPQTWILGMYGCLMYVPLSGLADLWAIPYVQQSFNTDRGTAASSVTLFYIGLACGAPLWAILSNKLQSHLKPMQFSALLTGIMCFLIVIIPFFHFQPIDFGGLFEITPLLATSIFFFFGGAFSAGQFMAFAVVAANNSLAANATATGVHNMLCMVSGVAQAAIGLMLDWSWNGTQYGGVPVYETIDYQKALAFVPVCLFAALILTFFIKEKNSFVEKET